MPPLRPLTRLAALTVQSSSRTTTRTLSTTTAQRSAPSHEDHYDPPTGWLWGVPPGQQREKEGWEGIWYWGFYGSLALAAVAYCYKPDTRYVGIFFGAWRGGLPVEKE